jgi:cytochrome c biogenesis protein CcmG, thiol:disulfide interchange protein DsbE
MNQKAKVNQPRKGSRPQGGNQGRSGGGGNRDRRPPRYGKPAPAARRNRTWWIWGGVAAVFIVAIVVAVVASGGGDDAKATAHETGAVTVDGTPLPQYDSDAGVDSAIGDTIPTLTGVTFDGSKVTIAPTGKPQVVMFLAHWCPHCQAEVPRIVDLAKQGAFKGMDVAAVATGTSAEAPNYPPSAWLERENWPFPVMVDSLSGTAAQAYGLSSYPYFVFVDAEGKVAGRAVGEIAPSDLQKILNALEAGKPLPKGSGASSSA